MDRLYDQAAKHQSRAAPYLNAARMTSYRIHGDNARPVGMKGRLIGQDDTTEGEGTTDEGEEVEVICYDGQTEDG